MLSFRYHAVSLVAVFMALALGIVLGVAIGDQGVVSGANRDLEKSLRGDLKKARERNRDLQDTLSTRNNFEEKVYPELVEGMLRGKRVTLLAVGKLPDGYLDYVQDALEPTRARLVGVNTVAMPLDTADVADDLGPRGRRAVRGVRRLKLLGRRLGRQLASGGELPERLRHSIFSSSRGGFSRVNAVVLVRDRGGLEGRDKARADAFEDGLFEGLGRSRARVVGVASQDSDPSQVGFFKERDLGTVDNIDVIAGRVALVYVLAGAEGNFGAREDELVPPAPPRRG